MIELIARNKLLEYLNLRPDAKIPLLTWLKEDQINRHRDVTPVESQQAICQLGASIYQVDIRVNSSLKIAYVRWLGTDQELHQVMLREMERLGAKHQDLRAEEKISTKIVLITPPPLDVSHNSSVIQNSRVNLPSFAKIDIPDLAGETFSSKASYEQAIDRALDIFDSRPGTPDFDELATLIPLIRSYEAQYIRLPQLDLSSAVKSRMEEFQIQPEQLPSLIGSREEIDLFLSGKQSLAEEQLRPLLKMLGFHFTV